MTAIDPAPFRALRHLALVYEVNRPVADEAVAAALATAGATGPTHTARVQPLGQTGENLPAGPPHWQYAFARTAAWLDELEQALAQAGAAPTVHVFARAPLPLLLYLGMRLDRHHVVAYQEDRATGAFRPACDSALPPADRPFFTITGLPDTEQRGRGDVLLGLAVTHPISDQALRTLGRDPSPLAEVRPTAAAGPGQKALQHPAQAAAATAELRAALDALHVRLPGADRVLLGGALPAALAVALGRALTPRAQHPLVLCNYRDNLYTAVHTIEARPHAGPPAPEPAGGDLRRAAACAARIAQVHRDLATWLERQGADGDRFGGARFTSATVATAPAEGPGEFDLAYLEGQVRLGTPLLLMLDDLAGRCAGADWEELVRLFLLHEGHHIQQGLTTYAFENIGRSSVVLEAIDYDADALAVEACLRFRLDREPAPVGARGEMAAAAQVLENVVRGLVGFDEISGLVPLRRFPERRLRRYLLWYLQLARARAAAPHLPFAALRLRERPAIEAPGVPTFVEPRGRAFQTTADLSGLEQAGELGLDIYLGGRLYREQDPALCRALLAAIRDGRRDDAVRALHALLDRARWLVPGPP